MPLNRRRGKQVALIRYRLSLGSSARASRLRLGLATSPLRCERGEVLLAALEGRYLFAGRALEVHAEPKDRNEEASHTGRNVLGDLAALFAGKSLDLLIVGLDFGDDRRAIHEAVLRLNRRDRLRRAPSTR